MLFLHVVVEEENDDFEEGAVDALRPFGGVPLRPVVLLSKKSESSSLADVLLRASVVSFFVHVGLLSKTVVEMFFPVVMQELHDVSFEADDGCRELLVGLLERFDGLLGSAAGARAEAPALDFLHVLRRQTPIF